MIFILYLNQGGKEGEMPDFFKLKPLCQILSAIAAFVVLAVLDILYHFYDWVTGKEESSL
ncbi:MAG: hypothetical protein A2734_00745 [Parcubacteria group bacterium RIFCSPHIGHO2_01_FULL_40_30]|nr:MAG: hypothetical protein A2734_00745 [Parcubacteria group bacterium RIFCSPHIGHO2_01_FULL_40_30]OHB23679.1 MAG: hypothetical protein A3I22_02500 [Parcubacteria group bacterium RIFCSPLOWO2_02_FULL_40_12]OHB24376.1 MAG: hypothetical protein A3F96_00690 [Parcubacteria group bacterium RIFCSPLOWO2_12_FULL_40_10]